MKPILHIGLILCGVYAVSPFCLDGEKSIVDGTRCRKYVECENGGWFLKQCQIGEQFNPRTASCESANESGCENGKARCEEGRTFSHPGSNSLFYQCQNGRIATRYCGAGEVFDQETEQCHTIGSLLSGHKRDRRSANGACDEDVKRRDGKSCTVYVECINGQEVKKECPPCMNFDEIRQSCRFNLAYPCGPESIMPTLPPRTTTPEPTSPSTTPEPPTSPSSPEPPTSPSSPEPPTSPSSPEPPTSPSSPEPPTSPSSPEPPTSPSSPEPPTSPQTSPKP